MTQAPELQIIISSGPEDPRSALGFAAAAAAAACHIRVVVFLTLAGAQWASKFLGNESDMPGGQPVSEALALILGSGGRIEVCSSCLGDTCFTSRKSAGGALSGMREGIYPGGLAAVAARMTQIPTVTF